MTGAVVPSNTGLVPIAISALGGAIAIGGHRLPPLRSDWPSAFGEVRHVGCSQHRDRPHSSGELEATWLSELITPGLQFLPLACVLAAVMLFVTVLTNLA